MKYDSHRGPMKFVENSTTRMDRNKIKQQTIFTNKTK